MSTNPPITKTWHNIIAKNVTKAFKAKPFLTTNAAHSVLLQRRNKTDRWPSTSLPQKSCALDNRTHWQNKEYREAYMEAAVEQGIAWQIRINRKYRGMSQKSLAFALGTKQSAISRLEDPEYGAHSLETLMEIAKAFDCALLVKFISYAQLAEDSENLSEIEQYAPPFYLK